MKKGIIYAILAYVLWGFFPIYFKWLHGVPALQIMAHRVVWSFFFLALYLFFRREINSLIRSLNRRTVLIYLAAGSLLAVNWLTYVWAVNQGRVVESSLGYFINPLVSVSLGVIFLRERLRVYHAQTKPLVDYYSRWAAQGDPNAPKIARVVGTGSVEEIRDRIFAALR